MIRVNGRDEDAQGETVEQLLERRGVDGRGIAVAIDGIVVRRAEWRSTVLQDGCSVEIVSAAAGG